MIIATKRRIASVSLFVILTLFVVSTAFGQIGIGAKLLAFSAPQLFVETIVSHNLVAEGGLSNGGLLPKSGLSFSGKIKQKLFRFNFLGQLLEPFWGGGAFISFVERDNPEKTTGTALGVSALVGLYSKMTGTPFTTVAEFEVDLSVLPLGFGYGMNFGVKYDF